jgi:hypothetical protein
MQRTDARRSNAMTTPVDWRWVWLGLGLLLAAWPAAVLSQEPASASAGEVSDVDQDSFWFSDRFTGRDSQALGALFRAGFVTGPGIGREDSFVPFEFMPYSLWGDGMFFGDLRGFRTTQDQFGFNTGGGYRHYFENADRIVGINAFYDYDNSATELFRQWGMGIETLGSAWDMRLNTYFPLTTQQKLLDIDFVPDSVRFSGNSILFDQIRTLGTHMKGLDHEIGVPLPGRIAEHHDVRLFGGWYYFQADGIDDARGWKARLQGNLLPNVSVGLEVSNDAVFDTNAALTVAVSYGGYHQPNEKPKTQFDRMTTPVQRQYNIVIARTFQRDVGLTALKPDGTPYFVEHVAGNDPYDRADVLALQAVAPQYDPLAVLGTYENPYLTILDAQNVPGGDIIYTWTNSRFTNTAVTLESNVRVLGEGDEVVDLDGSYGHKFLLNPFGFVDLPRAVNDPDPFVTEVRPLFANSPGDGVTLTSDAEFSGFQIGDPTDSTSGASGNGVFGNAVTNVDVDFVDVNFANADGVLLQEVGEVRFFLSRIFNSTVNGLHVDGGIARVTFEGDGDDNTADIVYNAGVPAGSAVLIENTIAGSFVDLFGASPSAINYTGAGGILVQDAAGSAQFGDVQIANTVVPLGDAINIIDSSGAYTFASPVVVNASATDSINIENLALGGVVAFQQPVTITNRGAHGVDLLNNDGNVRFVEDLTISTPTFAFVSASPAIEYQFSGGDVSFRNVTILGGSGEGITIGQPEPGPNGPDPDLDLRDPTLHNSGDFLVTGNTNIDFIAGINIHVQEDDATVTFNGVDIQDRGTTAIRLSDNNSPITFNSVTTVGNDQVAVDGFLLSSTAVVIHDNATIVRFEGLTVNDAYNSTVGTNIVAGVSVTDGDPVDDSPADPFDANNNDNENTPSTVIFNSLNITTFDTVGNVDNAGTAFFARFVGDFTSTPVEGGLFVDTGVINAINETAIDVQASVIGLTFDSVSALDTIGPGIILANNVSGGRSIDFLVTGTTTGALNSGGTITNSQFDGVTLESQTVADVAIVSGAGVLLRDTGVVSLNDMLIEDSEIGVDAETTALLLNLMQIQNNDSFGLDALDVETLQVTNSTFTGNGLGIVFGSNEIRSRVATVDNYNWLFDGNTITDIEDSAVVLSTLAAGNGSSLVLTFTNNDVLTTATTLVVASNLEIDWNGPLDAFIDTNDFQFLAVLDSGVSVTTTSTLDTAIVTISNNTFQGTGVGNVGIEVVAQGPSSYLIEDNIMQHNNPVAAMTFFLADGSNTTIRDNTINILGEESDGLVFSSISAPAALRIEGNDIVINGTDFFFDEFGINIQATSGVIDFFGDTDNLIQINGINGIGFPWFNFPLNGQFTGSILVNGNPEP